MTVAVAVFISLMQLACTNNVPDCLADAACSGKPAATLPPVLIQARVRTSQMMAASAEEKKRSGRQVATVPPILMQTRVATSQLTTVSAAAKDAEVAAHVRSYFNNSANIAKSLQDGISAIMTAVVSFSTTPPQITEGITSAGSSLLVIIEVFIPQSEKNTALYKNFQQAWNQLFQTMPTTAQSVKRDIERFAQNGDPNALARGINTIINEAGVLVSGFLPPQTGKEVLKYLDALTDAMEAMGTSWDAFAKGQTVPGIEAVYWSLRNITNDLMPAAIKDNKVYDTIIGTLDGVIGQLSKNVLEYERRIIESTCCWRLSKPRPRQRPQICMEKYVWDGQAHCTPLPSLLESRASSVDGALARKASPAKGTLPAHCNATGDFPEKLNQFCYAPCPSGFVSSRPGTGCDSSCAGRFPVSSPAMCARDQGMLMKAIMEMVTVVMNSAFSLADHIMRMQKDGVNGQLLSSTIQVFIDLGKPFTHPQCPTGNTKLSE